MPLPSTVTFAAGDTDYIAKLNQLITDFNVCYSAFLATTSGELFSATSTTSNAIGTGSKTFTLVEGTQRAFAVGSPIRVADSAAPQTNYMDGSITAYAHPSITVNVTAVTGSGTKTAWRFAIAAIAGTVPVASGGTGATTAAAARTNLGLGTAATTPSTDYATAAQGVTANNALPKAGGTLSGAVAAGSNDVTGIKVLGRIAEYDNGNSGAAKTIDWANGGQQGVTLNANTTLTINTPTYPGFYQLRLVQDATGSRTVAWSGLTATRWLGATSAPAINAAANGETIVSMYYSGANVTQSLSKVGAV